MCSSDLTHEERIDYIRAELRAVREANAQGWIAWSAGNKYEILFDVLRRYRDDAAPAPAVPVAAAATAL